MEQAMSDAEERLVKPVDSMIPGSRHEARAQLAKELQEDNPIVVLSKRFRQKEYISTFEELSNPINANRLAMVTRDIRVLNRWIGRFGANGDRRRKNNL